MWRIAIFASGEGTTAEAVIRACNGGRVEADVVLVIGCKSTAEVFTRAPRLGVATRHLSGRIHPEADQLDAAIFERLKDSAPTHMVSLAT